MTCQECYDLLSALIDRELSAEELEKVRLHLQECVNCCKECAELCCMKAAAAQAYCPEVPIDLWDHIQDRIEWKRNVVDFAEARLKLSRVGRM